MWAVVRVIDPDVEAQLRAAAPADPRLSDLLADYVLELYMLRSAERVSHRIAENWSEIRVGHAVGASACFPPVFPPFLVYGVYDDLHVPRLGLTDGGVYDNVGATALLDEGCTEIIASDTSGLFNTMPAAASGHLGLAARIPDLLMRALGGVQREGLLALALGAIGVYGVVAHFVTRRRRDWVIRMALGMKPVTAVQQVVGRGVLLVGAGCVLGTGASLLLTRLLASLLYGVGAADPLALAAAVAALIGTGCVAALIPGIRAGRTNPAQALRDAV